MLMMLALRFVESVQCLAELLSRHGFKRPEMGE